MQYAWRRASFFVLLQEILLKMSKLSAKIARLD